MGSSGLKLFYSPFTREGSPSTGQKDTYGCDMSMEPKKHHVGRLFFWRILLLSRVPLGNWAELVQEMFTPKETCKDPVSAGVRSAISTLGICRTAFPCAFTVEVISDKQYQPSKGIILRVRREVHESKACCQQCMGRQISGCGANKSVGICLTTQLQTYRIQ